MPQKRQIQIVNNLYHSFLFASIAGILITLILYFFTDIHKNHIYVTPWLVASVGVYILRLALYFLHKKKGALLKPSVWELQFNIWLSVSGLLTGLFGYIFINPGINATTMVFTIIIAGMISGAIGSYSLAKYSFYVYSAPLIIPFLVNLVISSPGNPAIIALYLTYYLIMTLLFRQSQKNMFRSWLLTEKNLQLQQNLLLYKNAFTHSYEGMIITDADKLIIDINNSFTRITGYSREESLGKNPKFLASGRHDALFYKNMIIGLNNLGFWEGEIWNKHRNGNIYPELLSITKISDTTGNEYYIGIFSDISIQKANEANLKKLAEKDSLTGLYNRHSLQTYVEDTTYNRIANNQKLALLFMDLNKFKEINDNFGHDYGDEVLKLTAKRLSQTLRKSDFIARFGGDEFVVLAENFNNIHEIENLCQKLIAAFEEPFIVKDKIFTITTSIGISICPQDGKDYHTILKNADKAMYAAKATGMMAYRFYSG